jgi:hypothetical protein
MWLAYNKKLYGFAGALCFACLLILLLASCASKTGVQDRFGMELRTFHVAFLCDVHVVDTNDVRFIAKKVWRRFPDMLKECVVGDDVKLDCINPMRNTERVGPQATNRQAFLFVSDVWRLVNDSPHSALEPQKYLGCTLALGQNGEFTDGVKAEEIIRSIEVELKQPVRFRADGLLFVNGKLTDASLIDGEEPAKP